MTSRRVHKIPTLYLRPSKSCLYVPDTVFSTSSIKLIYILVFKKYNDLLILENELLKRYFYGFLSVTASSPKAFSEYCMSIYPHESVMSSDLYIFGSSRTQMPVYENKRRE